jgi:hypothetical protein
MQEGLRESGTSDVKAEVTGEVLAKGIAFTVKGRGNGRVPEVNLLWAPDGPPVAIMNGKVRVTIQLANGRTLAGFIVSTKAYPNLSSGHTRFEVVIDWDPLG